MTSAIAEKSNSLPTGIQFSAAKSAGSGKKNGKFPTVLVTILVIAIIGALVANTFLRQETNNRFLSADSTSANGAGALAALLRSTGVEFINVEDQHKISQISDQSTVVLVNPEFLHESDIKKIQDSGAAVLLLVNEFGYFLPEWGIEATTVQAKTDSHKLSESKNSAQLSENTPLDSPFSSKWERYYNRHKDAPILPARCNFAPAVRAEKIGPVQDIFTGFDFSEAACFRTDSRNGTKEAAAALISSAKYPNVYAFSAPVTFTNAFLAHAGNAAFALNLLGAKPTLYWVENYSSPEQFDDNSNPADSAELPEWISIFAIASLLSGFWFVLYQGRRFGKLVPEPLPVVVPSGETDFGRAQLYAQGKDFTYLARIIRNEFLMKYAKTELNGVNPAEQNDRSIAISKIADTLHKRSGQSPDYLADVLFSRPIKTKSELKILQKELADLTKEL